MKLLRYGVPLFLSGTLIFYLSTIPQDDLPKLDIPYIDKMVHLFLYGLLGFCLARWLTYKKKYSPFKILAIVVVFGTLYGIKDEFHQSFTPGRSVELADVVADFFGALIGALLIFPYRKYISRPKTEELR